MKKLLLLIPFLLIAAVVNGQWIQNSSCDKKANIVANQAIEYMANLEYLSALGAANSALLLDENCGCAKLTLAAISSQNPKWGSRIQKLDEIDTSKLTAEEKAWYNYLRIVDNLKRPEFQITIQNKFPKSPLINYLGTSVNDFNSYKLFTEKFPTYSSSAYNMISYGYMMGAFGEINMEEAKKYIEMSKNMHFGPNSFDSMGEHYASVGDYEKALESQLTAIDFATFASPYYTNAQLYSAKMSKDKISQTIMDNQKVMQSAILNGDYESYKEFEHPEIVVTTGDSNLNPFYVFTKDNLDEDAPMTWNAFNLSNFEVYFSPDMKSSVITFDADGSFTMIDSKIKIDYSTRGSATWVSTTEGWKILHSSYAPRKGKNGLPDVN
ncbi:nuclear transport factor 2 family protein [Flavobacteriaceae bacterium]|nr:nuclear transport factor 2 family protein [Flavobacteriaceae bacterium]MDC0107831.1 nuclear transport factor 2 family protein [Flavobacteriaceae bacterium]